MLLKIFSNIYVNVSINKYKCYKKSIVTWEIRNMW